VATLPVRLDARHERDDAVDDAAEVDAEHPVPVLVGRVGDVVEEVDPGVVAEHGDLAEHLLRLVGGARERLAVGDVELDRVHVELRCGCLEVVVADVGDCDPHARVHERPRHAEPDAAAAAGDEGDSSFYVKHGLRGPYTVAAELPRRPRWRP
jgi:hypothetical protein